MKVRVVTPDSTTYEYTVKASRRIVERNYKNIGLSIMNSYSKGETKITPSIPGAVFINNDNFGKWVDPQDPQHHGKQDLRIWSFYRSYDDLPEELGWGSFTPTYGEYKKISDNLSQYKQFKGSNGEFGRDGTVSRHTFPSEGFQSQSIRKGMLANLKTYLSINFPSAKNGM